MSMFIIETTEEKTSVGVDTQDTIEMFRAIKGLIRAIAEIDNEPEGTVLGALVSMYCE